MRRTLALVLALPAALAILAPTPDAPRAVRDAATRPPTTADASGVSAPAVTTGIDPITSDEVDDGGAPDPGAADTAASDGVVGGAAVSEVPAGPPIESTFVVAPVPESGGVGGSGPLWRYTVEVEPELDVDPALLAAEVRAALHDARSWARERTMQQVTEPSLARIRVVLATPRTVDELCGRVGLNTAGIYSCWNGRFAVLNAWRWDNGADGFADLATYRTYLVNHEVGHAFGYGHVDCPGAGAPAPVMMQQSKGLGPCTANGWPYP